MAPRFQTAFVLLMKRTMLPRAPLCKFTEDDLRAIQAETGLDRAQVEDWEKKFRFRVPEEGRAAALQQDATEKVGTPLGLCVGRTLGLNLNRRGESRGLPSKLSQGI